MNTKRIDFVAKTYEWSGSDAVKARLALFRPVWEAEARASARAESGLRAERVGETSEEEPAWSAPDPALLEQWYWSGTPFLTQAPVDVSPKALAQAAAEIAAALGKGGAAERADGAAWDWKALVGATPVTQAGRNPGAYLDACADAAVEQCGDDAATALLVLSMALRTQLEPAAARLMDAVAPRLAKGSPLAPKPRACPVCGSEAALAHVGPTETNKANVRTLWCGQCGTTWEFERIRCVRCGTQSQGKLHYTSIEGDEAHRIHRCDECNGYVRTHFALNGDLAPFSPEVEDVVMADLDEVAADMGLGEPSRG